MRKSKNINITKRVIFMSLILIIMVYIFPWEIEAYETNLLEQGNTETVQEKMEADESYIPEQSDIESQLAQENLETDNDQIDSENTDTSTISGVLWLDAKEDGIRDADVTGIENYPVFLYAADNLNDPAANTVTNQNGLYMFTDHPPGEYVVGIRANENDTDYLLPLVGIDNDNKFEIDKESNTRSFTKVITIESKTIAGNYDGGMRKTDTITGDVSEGNVVTEDDIQDDISTKSTLTDTENFYKSGSIVSALSGSGFVTPPPTGSDISQLFHFVEGVEINSYVDPDYQNVAVITPDKANQFGGIWKKKKLDLNKPFNLKMYIYLNHAEDETVELADGMTFTMHNDSNGLNAIGGRGAGLGAYTGRAGTETDGSYLRNSLVIEFDTYRNGGWGEMMQDPKDFSPNNFPAHCSLVIPRFDYISQTPEDDGYNGHINTYFFKPSQKWVEFEAEWTPISTGSNTGGILEYTFDKQKMDYTIDNINTFFGGSEVYWGFTGSTGEHHALQAVAVTELPIQEPLKKVSENSLAGVGGTEVNVGDEITYEISCFNSTGKTADLTIIDTLPDGLEYVSAKDENDNKLDGYTKDDRNIVWMIPNVNYGDSLIVTITARVTEDEDEKVTNKAKLEWNYAGGSLSEDVEAENPVNPRKTVMINYVDHKGESIKTSTVERINVNEYYTYTVPNIDGYEFDIWKFNGELREEDPDTTFKVIDDTVIDLIYKEILGNFSFYKVDMLDISKILSDAEFELYLWEGTGDVPDKLVPKDLVGSGWTLIGTKTGDDGSVLFENLSPGIYQLVETMAPTGYQLPQGQWRFEVNNKGGINILPCVGENKPPVIKENDMDEIPYLIRNVILYKLPETGGRGIIWYSVIGILLLAIGLATTIMSYIKNRGF